MNLDKAYADIVEIQGEVDNDENINKKYLKRRKNCKAIYGK